MMPPWTPGAPFMPTLRVWQRTPLALDMFREGTSWRMQTVPKHINEVMRRDATGRRELGEAVYQALCFENVGFAWRRQDSIIARAVAAHPSAGFYDYLVGIGELNPTSRRTSGT